jgi:hypothetical protein
MTRRAGRRNAGRRAIALEHRQSGRRAAQRAGDGERVAQARGRAQQGVAASPSSVTLIIQPDGDDEVSPPTMTVSWVDASASAPE